jgi:ABC-2 type transport system permease protein
MRFSAHRVREVVKKEVRQLLRDPRARPILFVAPVIQLVLMGYAATTDVRSLRTAVVDHDRTAASRALVEAYAASGYFEVISYSDRSADVARALDRGDAIVGIEIPPGFARDLRAGRAAPVQALVDGSDSNLGTVAQGYVTQVTQRFGAREAGAAATGGIDVRARAWYNPALESRMFNIPGVMGAMMMLVGLLLTSLAVVREKELGTLDQLLVSPITPVELMLGKTVPVLGVGLVHLAVQSTIAVAWFGVPLRGSIPELVLAAVLFILAALSFGLLISTISRTQQEAFMSMFLFFLPAVILSGFLFPIDSMPGAFRWTVVINPLGHFIEIVRGVFLKGTGIPELWPHYLAVAVMSAVALAFAARRFARSIT